MRPRGLRAQILRGAPPTGAGRPLAAREFERMAAPRGGSRVALPRGVGEDLDAVLEPLRSREQVLDELLAGARRAAEDALAAARHEGARLAAEARRGLDAELAADR